MSKPRSTNISTGPTGGSVPTPIRAIPGRADPQCLRQGDRQLLAVACLSAGNRPRPPARATSISTISTCWPAIAPAGRCAPLLTEGLNGVPGKVEAGPPRHLSSAVGLIVKFSSARCRTNGPAPRPSARSTPIWRPFLRKDQLTYEAVRQSIQELVYNLNVPSRWGTQTPFTNLTFDWDLPPRICKIRSRSSAARRCPSPMASFKVEMDRDGPDQPRLYGGDDQGRRQGPGLHLSHPHLQHHPRFPLGERERRPTVRNDGQIRPALFPELSQFGTETQHGPLHVLPAATRSDRAAEARQRIVRQCRADRFGGGW